jgi:NADH-ubiquinone oxidoreductase chain 2
MIIITMFFIIISMSLPFIKNLLISSSIIIRRLCAIAFLYAGVLLINTLYIQLIGSGIGLYSGLFQINLLSNLFSLFILLLSAIILLIWPNTFLNNNLGLGVFANKKNINFKENYNNISNYNKSNEYCLIIIFNILGAFLLLSSSDLISMYLSIELQSFGLYILATLYKEKLSASSAGLKYFLLGGLSSCLILLGSGLIYTYTGLTNLDLIYSFFSIYFKNDYISLLISNFYNFDTNILSLGYATSESIINNNIQGVSIGFLLIFVGFFFKIAAAPFHNWAPDVYDDSPTLVTIWLTIMPKISILIFLLQLLIGLDVNLNLLNSNIISLNQLFFEFNSNSFKYFFTQPQAGFEVLNLLLIISSLLSLIIGSVVGLSQIRIKRLLAYSTINHVGFLLLSLSVFSNSSIESFLFYLFQYTITNLNIFLIILALSYIINFNIENNYKKNSYTNFDYLKNFKTMPQFKTLENVKLGLEVEEEVQSIKTININISDIEYINSFKGLFFKNPILSLSLSICLFSFAGVPPLIGFFAKQQILYSSNFGGYFFLSLIAILVSVISAFYYLKIIKIIFSPSPSSNSIIYPSSSVSSSSSQSIITYFKNLKNENILSVLDSLLFTQLYKKENNINILSNIHSFFIGILTLFIMIFILNPELILNSIALLCCFCLNL